MFGLFYGLYKYMFEKPEFHIIVLGLDGAGKTVFLEQVKAMYIFNKVKGQPIPQVAEKTMPTVGLNIGKIEHLGVKITLWDLGGQKSLRGIWEKYYEESHAIIFMIDSTNESRFDEAKRELEQLLRHPRLQEAPLLIFSNKQDLPNAKHSSDIKEIFGPSVQSRQFQVLDLCALKGNGVSDGLSWICNLLKKEARNIPKT